MKSWKTKNKNLHRLANEALKKGIPLTQDEKFMAQNHKVDELVVKIQIKKGIKNLQEQ